MLLGDLHLLGLGERRQPERGDRGRRLEPPGLAGLISTTILLITYVGVATAVLAWHGIGARPRSTTSRGSSAKYAESALGDAARASSSLLAVVVSALASTQTTILPASRTALSMARHEAIPNAFGEVSKRFFTPVFATVAVGVLATALVRAGQADQQDLPVRLADGPRPDDRLLLRADRVRLRHLLPARDPQDVAELPLHRGRAADRRAAPHLRVRQGALQLLRHRELLLDQRVARLRAARP